MRTGVSHCLLPARAVCVRHLEDLEVCQPASTLSSLSCVCLVQVCPTSILTGRSLGQEPSVSSCHFLPTQPPPSSGSLSTT